MPEPVPPTPPTAGSGVLGYIVLTQQSDGTWQPDWDGLLHPTLQRAAESIAGPDAEWLGNVILARVIDPGEVPGSGPLVIADDEPGTMTRAERVGCPQCHGDGEFEVEDLTMWPCRVCGGSGSLWRIKGAGT